MSIYCASKNGRPYILKEPYIAKGGEGAIYEIEGYSNMVAKLYFDGKGKYDGEKENKLLTMIQSRLPQEAMDQVTWPIDVLYDNGKFVGYVMRRIISGEALNVIYSDKYKGKLSLDKRIIIAKNLCAAVDAVHSIDQVIGDFNPNNILVVPETGNIILVDTDSYHITNKQSGEVYRCVVGLPQYVAKELQLKMSKGSYIYADVPLPSFTRETDLFALAVHIFAILMNGCHPFACAEEVGTLGSSINMGALQQSSVAIPQPNENICEGFFPFAQYRTGVTVPYYAPSYDMLTLDMRNMFTKAFIDGDVNPMKRPSAEEWFKALERMEKHLIRCENDHVYCDHSQKCPWCDLEVRLGQRANFLQKQSYVKKINPAVNNITPPEPNWEKVPTWGKASTFWIVTLLAGAAILAGIYFFTSPSWMHYGGNSGFVASNASTGVGVFGQIFVFIGGIVGLFTYNSKATPGVEGYTAEHYFFSIGSCILGSILGLIASVVLGIVFPIAVIGGMLFCFISAGG